MLRLIAAAFLFIVSVGAHAAQAPAGVLVVGQIAEPDSLDPQHVSDLNDFRILMNVYEGLVRYKNGTLDVEPALATGWDISDDGTIYTFRLRKGVSFHDGSAFNAAAVTFSFERMLDKDSPYHTGAFPLAFHFSSVKSVEAVDEFTVRFTLSEPFAPFLSDLAYPAGLIVSPAAVKKYGADFDRHPSGTGPFRFEEWDANFKVVLSRNDAYWDKPASLKSVIFRPVADANTRMAEMLSGGIDVMVEVPPDNVATFRKDASFTVHEQVGPHLWFAILDTKEGPFKSKAMRQAVNYAVNKKALVDDILQGTAKIAAGPVPPAFGWAHDDDLKPYPYDPDKALALIAKAGMKGAKLTFYVAQGGSGMLEPVVMATAIQADLAAVGLTVIIESYEWNTYLGKVNPGLTGKADMAEMAWMTNDPDTLSYLALRSGAFPGKGGFNSGYYSNSKVDRLLARARRSTDRSERARLYRKVQKIVHDDAPWLFVANWKQNAVTTARVKNFRLQPSFFLLLKDVVKQ